jgi:hypothetical protein
MPNQNKTGPEGQGPLTGRGFGKCRQTNQGPSEADQSTPFSGGMGQGRGARNGMGVGNGSRRSGGGGHGGRGGQGSKGGQGRR